MLLKKIMKKKNNNRKFKESAKIALSLFIRYCKENNVSNYFAVHFYNMLKNAIKTQNKDVLKQIIEILETVPKTRKTEKEILNSIRF